LWNLLAVEEITNAFLSGEPPWLVRCLLLAHPFNETKVLQTRERFANVAIICRPDFLSELYLIVEIPHLTEAIKEAALVAGEEAFVFHTDSIARIPAFHKPPCATYPTGTNTPVLLTRARHPMRI
jgi:hypothetical protein